MMYLKELNIGDKIEVFLNGTESLADYSRVTAYTSKATIVNKSAQSVVIAWIDGDKIPTSADIVRDKNTFIGYVAWMNASPNRMCKKIIPTDGPCRQCSKPNSSDVTKCWWCQVSYPTDLKRVGP